MEEGNKKSLMEDLKERRFFTYFFSYILGSFGIIQFADWYASKYELSSSIPTMAMIFLLAIFPSYLIFAWFHGRPGPDKWRPFEKFFIPTNLIIAIGLLFFLFSGKSMQASTETIKVVDEEGQEFERIVPKANFTHRLAMFPIKVDESMGEDEQSLGGIFSYLQMEDLEQDNRLYALGSLSMQDEAKALGHDIFNEKLPFSIQRKIADDLNAEYSSSGSMTKNKDGIYTVKTTIHSVKDGKVFFEKEYSNKNVFQLVDQFTDDFRSSLILSESSDNVHNSLDLPASDLLSNNMDAVKKYYNGIITMMVQNDVPTGKQLLDEAVEIDPRFANAYYMKAQAQMAMSDQTGSNASLKKAVELSAGLPERTQLKIKFNYLNATENLQKGIALLEMWSQLYPKDYTPYARLFSFYTRLNEINKAIDTGERAIENGHSNAMSMPLASLYNRVWKFEEAQSTLDNYIQEFPNKAKDNYEIGELFIQQGEFDKAEKHFEKIALLKPSEYKPALFLGEIARKNLDFATETKKYNLALSNAKIGQDSSAVYNKIETSLYFQGKINACNESMQQRWTIEETYTPALYIDVQRLLYPYLRRFVEAGELEYLDNYVSILAEKYKNGPDFFKCIIEMNYPLATENIEGINAFSDDCIQMNTESGGEANTIFINAFTEKVKGNCEKALSMMESFSAKTGTPNSSLAELMGDCYIQMNKNQNALDLIDVILKANPETASAHILKSKAFKGLGKNTEAKASYDLAMKIWKNADENFVPFQEAMEYGRSL